MFRLTLRSALAHWRRFVLTTVAVVVGVSFVVGSFVLTDSLAASINQLLADATSRTDFVVSPAGQGGRGPRVALGGGGGGGGGGSRATARVPATLVDQLAAVPGVRAVDPTVVGGAELLDKAGQAKSFDITFVSNWPAHPDMSAMHLVSGRAPGGPDDVVIDTATAADRNLRLGSRVRVATVRGVVTARVSGLAVRGTGNLGSAGTIVAFTLAKTTEMVGAPGMVGGISVQLAPGADRTAVNAQLSAVVGPDFAVLSSDTLLADARARIQDRLNNFNGLMLGFAAVTLFVSGFLIWNTFSTVLAQRTRELALLRAVGASQRQVVWSVTGEGALVGVVSSAIGIAAGVGVAIGLRALLGGFGINLPSTSVVLAPRSIVVGLVVGLGVTMVSVIGPALRTRGVAPIAAMQTAALPPRRGGRRGPIIGVVLLAIGFVLGARGLFQTTLALTPRLESLGLSAGLVFLGVSAISRYLASPIIAALGWPFRLLGGVPSKLARQNAVRDPRRTASTALALMIGIALVATTLVLGESVKTAFGGALRSSIHADVVVSADGISPFDPTTLANLAKSPGVGTSVPVSFSRNRMAFVDRGRIGVSTGDLAAIRSVVDPRFLSGAFPGDDSHIAVSKSFADEQHLRLGSTITLEPDSAPDTSATSGSSGSAVIVDPNATTTTTTALAGGPAAPPGSRVLRVSGIYQRDELLDDSVARPAAIDGLSTNPPVTKLVLVTTAQDPTTVAHRLAKVAADVPNSSALVTDDYVTVQTNSLDTILGIVDVLLLFAVLVAGLGIANTLALSVVERTRELGLLRAVGMERRAMRRMIRIEGVLVALFGGILGLGVGIGFGAAVASALPVDTAQLTFPLPRLVGLFVAAGLLGVISAAVPARRAARLDVLAAVAES